MLRWIRRTVVSVVLVGATALQAGAQTETGKIAGRVIDSQGAVIPGATVTATATTTQVTRTTQTDRNGGYVFANVPPASYEIKIELAGFRGAAIRTPVPVGTTVTVDATLELGGLRETVEVRAQDAAINVKTQEISTNITETQIRELPSLTRNPYSLVVLAGTASDQDPSGRGAGVAINGLRASATNVLLDGAANNDEFSATVGQAVPLDAVQEFSVISNSFLPQFGRATAGIVNVATKSGSNRFGGSAYEFFRNNKLSTNTFDNKARDIEQGTFNRHQFGGSLGGPIVRDRMFFFASAEGIRVRSVDTSINWVPTPQLLAASAPATQTFFSRYALATPINGPVITRGEISGVNPSGPFAALPASLPVFGQVQRSLPADAGGGDPQDTALFVGRVDYSVSPSTKVYGRYALERTDTLPGTVGSSPYAGFDTTNQNRNHSVLASLTNVWGNRFTTQSKAVFNRLGNLQPLGDNPAGPTLYMRSSRTSINGVSIALPGYLPLSPGSAIPFGGPQNFLQLYEDATLVTGAHDLRFGGSYVRIADNRSFGAFQNSVETLGSNIGSAFDNLVLGQLLSFQGAIDPQGKFPGEFVTLPVSPPLFSRENRYNEWALYFNDGWEVNRRLTVNLGVRYEYFGVQKNKDPQLDANFYYGQGSTIAEQVRNGRVFRAPESPTGGLWAPDWNNVAPRVGFAWDVTGDGRTSVRGGYGLGYERNFGNVTFNVIQNPPNYAVISLVAGTDVPSIPITADNAGPLAGTGSKVLPRTSLRHVDQNIQTAYAHLWSLSVQRQLWKGTVASLDYSASAGRQLYSLEDPNAPGSGNVYLDDTASLARLNTQYSNLNTRSNKGRSLYNGVVFGLDSRDIARLGLSITARYTLGYAKDNLSSTFSESSNNFNLGLLDPFNPMLDYGWADYDLRHRLSLSGRWELPFLRERGDLIGSLLGGWQIAAIAVAQSGAPFTVFDCSNGVVRCIRLLQVAPLTLKGSSTPPPSGDPNTFESLDLSTQLPGVGTYVNEASGTSDFGPFPNNMTARNTFRRPGRWNVDGILSKRFRMGSSRGLQLRLEAYNVFNHANLYIREGETDISAGPTIFAFRGDTGAGDGAPAGDGQRRLQLGLRFDF